MMMKIKIANLVQLTDHDEEEMLLRVDEMKFHLLIARKWRFFYIFASKKIAEGITCDDAATNMTYDVLSSRLQLKLNLICVDSENFFELRQTNHHSIKAKIKCAQVQARRRLMKSSTSQVLSI